MKIRRTASYVAHVLSRRVGIVANNRSVISIAFIVFGLLAVITCIVVAGYTGRWGDIRSVLMTFGAYAALVVIVVYLGTRAFSRSRRFPWVARTIGACAAVILAQFSSSVIAERTRETELRKAIDAGLEMDCHAVFNRYKTHPDFERDGFVRVFADSNEFQSLPQSIRMLNLGYVTVESHPFGTDMPPNIGLCTNGFGGFAFGVRVFMDRERIPQPHWRRAISPTIFIWAEQT